MASALAMLSDVWDHVATVHEFVFAPFLTGKVLVRKLLSIAGDVARSLFHATPVRTFRTAA